MLIMTGKRENNQYKVTAALAVHIKHVELWAKAGELKKRLYNCTDYAATSMSQPCSRDEVKFSNHLDAYHSRNESFSWMKMFPCC